LIPLAVIVLIAAVGAAVVLTKVLTSKAPSELVLTSATDPGLNPFMAPAASPPPTNTQPPPTLQPAGNGPVVTQPLPGDRDGLYGGTLNNAECDRDKMVTFLSSHPAQAGAFADALNTDPTLYWSGGHPLTAADIPTYLHELTPAVLRVDTRVTNHGFDGTHPTTLQSVFQTGTAVFVDAHGVPRARCYCGNPLTAPTALTGTPQPIGTAWAGYNPDALAAVQPSKTSITNFVLFDVVTGRFFNRPAGTTGTNDTPHAQPVAPPGPPSTAPTTGTGPQLGVAGTYKVHFLTYECSGRDLTAQTPDITTPFTLEGNTLTIAGKTGPLNADGTFVVEGPDGYNHMIIKGVFAAEGGRSIVRDGIWDSIGPYGKIGSCHGTWMATKQ
jgi:hypothetical protein